MARRFAIRIPGMRKSLSNNQMLWGGLGLAAAAAIYFITMNKQTGVPIIDSTLGQIGDITGLEGRFAPQAPVPPVPVGEPSGWSDWRFANAYQTYPDEMRFSNVNWGQ